MKKGLYKKCKVWWCNNPHYSTGYCTAHYRANKRFGSPYGVKVEAYNRIDNVIKLARQVSQAMIDSDGLLGECPYCRSDGEHKENCVIKDAESILKLT